MAQVIEKFVKPEMDAEEMAYTIFYSMKVMQSCKITGIELDKGRWKPKGEIVCDLLWQYDRTLNTKSRGATEGPRIKRKPPNSIGGYLADKIFRWKIDILENDVKYTIWRIQ
jgi:hypothetical protein